MKEDRRSRGARSGATGGKAKRTGKRPGSQDRTSKDSAGSIGENLIRHVAEAEVAAVEAHPKQPGMYRVAIRLYGEEAPDDSGAREPDPASLPESVAGDWNDEVDALIAGAVQASVSGRSETVVTVHEDTLVGLRLLKGRRLSPEEWEGLRREEDREDAYRAALAILERKARTSRELSDALKRKGYSPEVIGSCLDRLQSRRMLDDSAYARRYAEQRATGQRKGRRLIRQELLQRGIAKEDADRAIGELDGNAELEAALALARKKWPQLKGELRERKQKLAVFLLRRGYPGGVAREALDRVVSEASGTEHPDFDDAYEDGDSSGLTDDWDIGSDLSDEHD